MRTTLSLDDDVAILLGKARARSGGNLKQVVNDALRVGLARLNGPAPVASFRTGVVSLGRPLMGGLDDVADVLAASEGEGFA